MLSQCLELGLSGRPCPTTGRSSLDNGQLLSPRDLAPRPRGTPEMPAGKVSPPLTRGYKPGSRSRSGGPRSARVTGTKTSSCRGYRSSLRKQKQPRPYRRQAVQTEHRGCRRGAGTSEGGSARSPPRDLDSPSLTVDVLPVADVLQVAARVLAAQVRVGPVGLQPGVGIPPELRAGRHAARGSVPHLQWPPDSCCSRLPPRAWAWGAGGRGARAAGAWRGGPPARRRRRGRKPRPAPGSAAAAAAGPRHGRRRRRRRAGCGPGSPGSPSASARARPGPAGLSAAEERSGPRDCGRRA